MLLNISWSHYCYYDILFYVILLLEYFILCVNNDTNTSTIKNAYAVKVTDCI